MLAVTDFLLPNATFFAELVAFLVVLGVLAKWVLPYISKAMAERQAEILQGIEAGDEGRRLLQEARAERERLLEEARAEGRLIVEQATKVAGQAKEEILANAREEAARLLARAESAIQRSTELANEEVRRNLVELVMAAAERVIGAELDAAHHRRLIEEAAAELESSAS
ncbi:MAG: F0F1 ATP synthase subunit B [Actinomycetota bacterium]|nr:F0F1 ATP synthase subunit B [Actinomycetota bacterium]